VIITQHLITSGTRFTNFAQTQPQVQQIARRRVSDEQFIEYGIVSMEKGALLPNTFRLNEPRDAFGPRKTDRRETIRLWYEISWSNRNGIPFA
jgi:hypothetical protein